MLPTWNAEVFVQRTLESLAAQDHPDLSVLVLDDASTDQTFELCRSFAEGDSRFTVDRQAVRQGWIGNANALLDRASGEFVFFAPHDDLFDARYVSTLVRALEARPDAVLAYSHTVRFDGNGHRELASGEWPARPGGPIRRGLRYLFMADAHGRALPFRGVVRRDAAVRAAPLERSDAVGFGSDVRWLMRLNLLGPFVLVPEPLCEKRVYERGEFHAAVTRKTVDPDAPGAARRDRIVVRVANIRLRMQEQALYAAVVRGASLSRAQRTVLLAGVGLRAALGSLPWFLRHPLLRAAQRLIG